MPAQCSAEIGMSLGARNDNMVKYLIESGGLRGELQASAGEGNATTVGANGKSLGGLLRYAMGDFAVGGAYLEVNDTAGKKVKATTLGGGWTSGPWYVSAAWARNSFDNGFSVPLNAQLLGSIAGALTPTTTLLTGAAGKSRDMYSIGATYQLTPQLNLGAHYWHAKQDGLVAASDGKGDFFNVVADYAFSKRTDAYIEYDHTKIGGNLTLSNGAKTRDGFIVGMRHRF